MSNLGLGVMINMLGGNESSVKAFNDVVGKTIKSLELSDEKLKFEFEDGSKMQLSDEGQSCCEYRHMSTDDDLSYYVGAKLRGAELRESPPIAESEYGDLHEAEFLAIKTSIGEFVMVNHNEHNGYYGGFYVVASEG